MRRKAVRNFGGRPASVSLANPLRHLEGGLELGRYIQSRSLIFLCFLFLRYTHQFIIKYTTRQSNMADLSIERLDELENHVETLVAKPETQIDAKLFDDVELQLTREFYFLISIFS